MRTRLILGMLALTAIVAAACGGGSSSDKTATTTAATTPAKTAAPTQKPATVAATSAATTSSTPAPQGTTLPAQPTTASGSTGAVFDETQAKALIAEASLQPADIAAGWITTNDTPSDNAAAATADPTAAASIERCGRLAGRVLTNGPSDTVSAYLTGELVAAFSQLTVYKTADGATDCAAEGAARFAQPGQLARAFGTVFVNPEAVTVQPLEYPQVGDGSFAVALTGDINAAGTTVQLQIVLVAFRKGNTTAAVGVAMSPLTTPTTTEVKPYVDLVLQRITANQ